MTLIKSISGIRGTIGGKPNQCLSPLDIVKFTSAFAILMSDDSLPKKIVIGRDARLSGPMVSQIVSSTLIGCGFQVIDLGLSTTPSVEMAVVRHNAAGGIIITASHNPGNWNALKLLNHKGEFISANLGEKILQLVENEDFNYVAVEKLGEYSFVANGGIDEHIDEILKLHLVDLELIKSRNFKVAIDAVNSTGGIAIPKLLNKLGVTQIECLACEPTGIFAHNPEPLPENLTEISDFVIQNNCDIGIVVDPDVDRLCFINNDGTMFGEEYTLVAIADYVLTKTKGNTVSNLSSTRALKEISMKHGVQYFSAAVGEVNVVEKMKEVQAVIGGEGNGGVIYPALHYGRDALVGIALFLTHLAQSKVSIKELRSTYPSKFMTKNKIELSEKIDVDEILAKVVEEFKDFFPDTTDGVKIDFKQGWVHLRKSNTEPIIRIYSEANNEDEANNLSQQVLKVVLN